MDVSLRRDGQDVVLTIEDNGVGFETTASVALGTGHHGLRNMRSRAQALDGSLEIESTVGAGARLALRIPIQEGSLS